MGQSGLSEKSASPKRNVGRSSTSLGSATIECKKLLRLHLDLSNHRGNEFTNEATVTVEAFSPGNFGSGEVEQSTLGTGFAGHADSGSLFKLRRRPWPLPWPLVFSLVWHPGNLRCRQAGLAA